MNERKKPYYGRRRKSLIPTVRAAERRGSKQNWSEGRRGCTHTGRESPGGGWAFQTTKRNPQKKKNHHHGIAMKDASGHHVSRQVDWRLSIGPKGSRRALSLIVTEAVFRRGKKQRMKEQLRMWRQDQFDVTLRKEDKYTVKGVGKNVGGSERAISRGGRGKKMLGKDVEGTADPNRRQTRPAWAEYPVRESGVTPKSFDYVLWEAAIQLRGGCFWEDPVDKGARKTLGITRKKNGKRCSTTRKSRVQDVFPRLRALLEAGKKVKNHFPKRG